MNPTARTEALIVEDLGSEILVYDELRDKAHCLNGAAAFVWKQCDGARTRRELERMVEAELHLERAREVVDLALRKLSAVHLLESPVSRNGITRRELAKRMGIAAALLPAVLSITAPLAAQAVSCSQRGGCCLTKDDCCPGQSLSCQGPWGACPGNKRCF